jgi:hypothetical protein
MECNIKIANTLERTIETLKESKHAKQFASEESKRESSIHNGVEARQTFLDRTVAIKNLVKAQKSF